MINFTALEKTLLHYAVHDSSKRKQKEQPHDRTGKMIKAIKCLVKCNYYCCNRLQNFSHGRKHPNCLYASHRQKQKRSMSEKRRRDSLHRCRWRYVHSPPLRLVLPGPRSSALGCDVDMDELEQRKLMESELLLALLWWSRRAIAHKTKSPLKYKQHLFAVHNNGEVEKQMTDPYTSKSMTKYMWNIQMDSDPEGTVPLFQWL